MTPLPSKAPANAVAVPEFGGPGKRCPKCGEVWPLAREFFGVCPSSTRPVRWMSWCRACSSEHHARRRKAVANG